MIRVHQHVSIPNTTIFHSLRDVCWSSHIDHVSKMGSYLHTVNMPNPISAFPSSFLLSTHIVRVGGYGQVSSTNPLFNHSILNLIIHSLAFITLCHCWSCTQHSAKWWWCEISTKKKSPGTHFARPRDVRVRWWVCSRALRGAWSGWWDGFVHWHQL